MQMMSCILPTPERRQKKNMGLTHVTVRIANPADSKRHRDIDFLVDSGASYTVVPKRILQELGINPHSKRFFILANGEKLERRMGSVESALERCTTSQEMPRSIRMKLPS